MAPIVAVTPGFEQKEAVEAPGAAAPFYRQEAPPTEEARMATRLVWPGKPGNQLASPWVVSAAVCPLHTLALPLHSPMAGWEVAGKAATARIVKDKGLKRADRGPSLWL